MQILSHTNVLPLWFLVLAIFLPRISLLVAWLQGNLVPFHLQVYGWVPLIVAILVPRVLVLVLIYRDQGLSIWFLIHLIALILVWGGSGSYHSRRRD